MRTQSQLNFSPEAGMISIKEFLFKILTLVNSTEIPTCCKKSRGTAQYYYNIPAAFDIEVSSFYQDNDKKACMYVWQFGILNWVTYGRTWEEFQAFIKAISCIFNCKDGIRLVVYVHNLPYEFQFMRKRIDWDKIFFLDERKPVYAVTTDNIEFRCSWKLSSKSLYSVGLDLQKYPVEKKVGDLDYTLIRTPETELSQTELGYCENDIRVVLAYIQEKIEVDGSIAKIPLTNTGYVREYCRKECNTHRSVYMAVMASLILTPSEYLMLKRGYTGGFTHGSAAYVEAAKRGITQKNVHSYDFTSAYPAVMVLEKFPMSKGEEIKNIDMKEFRRYLHTHCCLIEVTLYGVSPRLDFEHPLSVSKCYIYYAQDGVLKSRPLKGELIRSDNGRVVESTKLTTTITEQDWFTITEFYKVESFTIDRLIVYKKSYLPKSFIRAILQLYQDKTKLKGVKGQEVNYMIKKNMANSAYGMTVTDIVRDEVIFDNENDESPFSSTKPDLEEVIKQYNESKKRFLFYPWGVWVCAYARRNLFTGIKECGLDYVYSDTDSMKILHSERHKDYIENYNKGIMKKIAAVCDWYGFKEEEFSPKTVEGKVKTIGLWDDEGSYDEFKTLGAKRYLTKRRVFNKEKEEWEDKYSLTVAGLNKEKAMEWMVNEAKKRKCTPFDLFNYSLKVPASHAGRLVHTYCDEPCEGNVVDYTGKLCHYREESYIHMEASGYDLTISDLYEAFLDYILEESEEMFI